MAPPIMTESEEELKSLLMKVRVKNVGLKLNIKKAKIMASSPITSCQIDGETVERVIKIKVKKKKIKQILFSWAPKSLQVVTAAMILKDTCFLEEKQ